MSEKNTKVDIDCIHNLIEETVRVENETQSDLRHYSFNKINAIYHRILNGIMVDSSSPECETIEDAKHLQVNTGSTFTEGCSTNDSTNVSKAHKVTGNKNKSKLKKSLPLCMVKTTNQNCCDSETSIEKGIGYQFRSGSKKIEFEPFEIIFNTAQSNTISKRPVIKPQFGSSTINLSLIKELVVTIIDNEQYQGLNKAQRLCFFPRNCEANLLSSVRGTSAHVPDIKENMTKTISKIDVKNLYDEKHHNLNPDYILSYQIDKNEYNQSLLSLTQSLGNISNYDENICIEKDSLATFCTNEGSSSILFSTEDCSDSDVSQNISTTKNSNGSYNFDESHETFSFNISNDCNSKNYDKNPTFLRNEDDAASLYSTFSEETSNLIHQKSCDSPIFQTADEVLVNELPVQTTQELDAVTINPLGSVYKEQYLNCLNISPVEELKVNNQVSENGQHTLAERKCTSNLSVVPSGTNSSFVHDIFAKPLVRKNVLNKRENGSSAPYSYNSRKIMPKIDASCINHCSKGVGLGVIDQMKPNCMKEQVLQFNSSSSCENNQETQYLNTGERFSDDNNLLESKNQLLHQYISVPRTHIVGNGENSNSFGVPYNKEERNVNVYESNKLRSNLTDEPNSSLIQYCRSQQYRNPCSYEHECMEEIPNDISKPKLCNKNSFLNSLSVGEYYGEIEDKCTSLYNKDDIIGQSEQVLPTPYEGDIVSTTYLQRLFESENVQHFPFLNTSCSLTNNSSKSIDIPHSEGLHSSKKDVIEYQWEDFNKLRYEDFAIDLRCSSQLSDDSFLQDVDWSDNSVLQFCSNMNSEKTKLLRTSSLNNDECFSEISAGKFKNAIDFCDSHATSKTDLTTADLKIPSSTEFLVDNKNDDNCFKFDFDISTRVDENDYAHPTDLKNNPEIVSNTNTDFSNFTKQEDCIREKPSIESIANEEDKVTPLNNEKPASPKNLLAGSVQVNHAENTLKAEYVSSKIVSTCPLKNTSLNIKQKHKKRKPRGTCTVVSTNKQPNFLKGSNDKENCSSRNHLLKRLAPESLKNTPKKLKFSVDKPKTGYHFSGNRQPGFNFSNFKDAQETADNNDPRWAKYSLNTREACFEAVCNEWNFEELPNPHTDLTRRHQYRSIVNNTFIQPSNRFDNICLCLYENQIDAVIAELDYLKDSLHNERPYLNEGTFLNRIRKIEELENIEHRLRCAWEDARRFYTPLNDWNVKYISDEQKQNAEVSRQVVENNLHFYGR